MAFLDVFKGLWGGKSGSLSARAEPGMELKPQMGFMDGTDGRPSLTWARYSGPSPFTSGYLGGWRPWWGIPGSEISRERALAAGVAIDLLTSNPQIAALVEQFATYAVGTGLTLSSRPNCAALGISQDAARELSDQIEKAWCAWAGSPLECDASGRHTLHQLATASFKSYLLTGENVFLLDWKRSPGAATKTKVQLLDSRQLAQEITRVADGGKGGSILQGVQFDQFGRIEGYWIRPFVLGNTSQAPQPVFVKVRTSWGRNRAMHLFDLLVPGQVRGLSPLIAALSPSHAKATLKEFTLASALVQSMATTTIESDLPTRDAMNALAVADPLREPPQSQNGGALSAWFSAKDEYWGEGKAKIDADPGKVVHLLPGEKLNMNRVESPNATFDPFDKSLAREAAKAAGSSYEDLTGDFSMTSFSASRLALELPWRINKRRRAAIVEPFYRAVFVAWLEEACETGVIKLPKGAPAFWENPAAYTKAVWRGEGKPVSDPLKQAQADVLRLGNGLTTYEAVLGENGMDFEETLAQQKSERQQREAAGLPYPTPKSSEPVTPEVTPEDDDPALS